MRVQNPLNRTWTLKGFQSDELNFEDCDEYFAGKVKDTSKFSKFDRITFIVHATANNANDPENIEINF